MSRYPTAAEMEVLSALKDYHFLTVEQIMLVTGRTSLPSPSSGSRSLLRQASSSSTTVDHPMCCNRFVLLGLSLARASRICRTQA
jgi:hypothetical protein